MATAHLSERAGLLRYCAPLLHKERDEMTTPAAIDIGLSLAAPCGLFRAPFDIALLERTAGNIFTPSTKPDQPDAPV
jgi:hypothetical protein